MSAKRLFSIQEERQAQYYSLRKIHLQYGAGECSHDYYKESVSRVTSVFQALSQEMLEIMKVFRDKNESEVVSILEQVQSSEKEKLELVVGLHLLTHTVSSSEDSEDKLYQLKKSLAVLESKIAELLQDLKYECEVYLQTDGEY